MSNLSGDTFCKQKSSPSNCLFKKLHNIEKVGICIELQNILDEFLSSPPAIIKRLVMFKISVHETA
jgi:hypothetical protein